MSSPSLESGDTIPTLKIHSCPYRHCVTCQMGEHTPGWRHAVWPRRRRFAPARVSARVRWRRLAEQHGRAERRAGHAEEHRLKLITRACNEKPERNEREVRQSRDEWNVIEMLREHRLIDLWKPLQAEGVYQNYTNKQSHTHTCGEKWHEFILWFGLHWIFKCCFLRSASDR